MNSTKNHLSDIIDRQMFHIMDIIFKNLNLIDSIHLASTNSKLKNAAYESSDKIKSIAQRNCFNLDLFPGLITKDQIEIIYQVFPNLEKFKVDMRFVKTNFFKHMKKFENLRKLSIYLQDFEDDPPYSTILNISSLTLRQQYYTLHNDAIYDILKNTENLRQLAIYEGKLSLKTIKLLNQLKLNKLKLHNTTIESCEENLLTTILTNKDLKYLRITCEVYMRYSQSFRLIAKLLSMINSINSNIETFIFTLESNTTIRYENLLNFHNLKRIVVYYSAQTATYHLNNLVKIAKCLDKTKLELIEYLEVPLFASLQTKNVLKHRSIHFEKRFKELCEKYEVTNSSINTIYHEKWTSMN